MHWAEHALHALAASGVDTLVHVPDIIINEVLTRAESDSAFTVVPTSREEDAVGVVCGLYLGGRRPILMMQNSGLGNATNALASLAVPYEIPVLMLISQRGGLSEWNPVQVPMSLAVRPLLDSLAIPHYTLTAAQDVEAVIVGAVKLAYETGRCVAVVLDSRLTYGGLA